MFTYISAYTGSENPVSGTTRLNLDLDAAAPPLPPPAPVASEKEPVALVRSASMDDPDDDLDWNAEPEAPAAGFFLEVTEGNGLVDLGCNHLGFLFYLHIQRERERFKRRRI